MAKKLSRHRKHSPEVLVSAYVESAYEVMDPDNTEEVLTTLYMAKNIVMGTRAADEFLLDSLERCVLRGGVGDAAWRCDDPSSAEQEQP